MMPRSRTSPARRPSPRRRPHPERLRYKLTGRTKPGRGSPEGARVPALIAGPCCPSRRLCGLRTRRPGVPGRRLARRLPSRVSSHTRRDEWDRTSPLASSFTCSLVFWLTSAINRIVKDHLVDDARATPRRRPRPRFTGSHRVPSAGASCPSASRPGRSRSTSVCA